MQDDVEWCWTVHKPLYLLYMHSSPFFSPSFTLQAFFFAVSIECNIHDRAISHLLCSFLLSPSLHPAFCSVLLRACASARQTLLKSSFFLHPGICYINPVCFVSAFLISAGPLFQRPYLTHLRHFLLCSVLFLFVSRTLCYHNLDQIFSVTCFHLVCHNACDVLDFIFIKDTKYSEWKQVILSIFTFVEMLLLTPLVMYIHNVGSLHLNLIHWLLLIRHEIRAELKMDAQNVVRWLYNDRWAKPWTYHLQCDWWLTCWKEAMRQGHVISINQYSGDVISVDQ